MRRKRGNEEKKLVIYGCFFLYLFEIGVNLKTGIIWCCVFFSIVFFSLSNDLFRFIVESRWINSRIRENRASKEKGRENSRNKKKEPYAEMNIKQVVDSSWKNCSFWKERMETSFQYEERNKRKKKTINLYRALKSHIRIVHFEMIRLLTDEERRLNNNISKENTLWNNKRKMEKRSTSK